jgi:GT2 family glycosyltransferase
MSVPPEISVIIVNYNVREFLYQCIRSIEKSLGRITHEIIVIDNASVDGSVEMVRREFPAVRLHINDRNTGFAVANNIGMKQARGNYLVLINPDTIVREDTFTILLDFMNSHPDAGVAASKILNPDGSFSVDSRHSIPTPATAFWKLIGLNRLFPRSRVFGRYNMTYLDQDEINTVDAVSGSFMMVRRETCETTGFLDEDYFMYCEDIDYCYRINQQGWKIYYVPETSIIHYKGESTKKDNLDYVINFNKSLYLFYRKHFHHNYLSLFRWVILAGVLLRAVVVYIKNLVRSNLAVLLDLVILNGSLFASFGVRFGIESDGFLSSYLHRYIFINLIASAVYLFSALFLDLYNRYRLSLAQVFKANILTAGIIAALTFFIRQLAFSRIVILISAVISIILMVVWRALVRRMSSSRKNVFSLQLFPKRAILIGSGSGFERLIGVLKNPLAYGYDLRGIVTPQNENIGKTILGIPVVPGIENLNEYIRLEKINQVIFSSHGTSYETIFRIISRINNPRIEFKIVPEKLDAIIGKSSVEGLADISLLDVDVAIGKGFNRFNKRLFDLGLSFILLIPGAPLWLIVLLTGAGKIYEREIRDKEGKSVKIKRSRNKLTDLVLLLSYIVIGKVSFVGAPLDPIFERARVYSYKPGLTGIVQINHNKINSAQDEDLYDLYYLKNQNFWLDLEILYKTIVMTR